MSRKYKFHNPEGAYFVTFTVRNWIDVFIRNAYKNILVDSLTYCQKYKGLEIFSWCIMSSHIHLIIRAKEGFLLQNILRDLKTFTSKNILTAIEENPQESRKEWLLQMFEKRHFWQFGSHPIEVWSNKVIHQKLNYIHQNPVKDGIVFSAEQYVYSSAIDYADGKGLLDVIVIR